MYLLAWIFIAVLVGWEARRMLLQNGCSLLQSGVLETR